MRYFDYNATAPLSDAAREAWLDAQDACWANPSSPTRAAAQARNLLAACRARLAAIFEVDPKQIVFTSGATEGNNAVIRQGARQAANSAIALSAIEHPSVREPAFQLFGQGRVRPVGVDRHGVLDLEALDKLCAEQKERLALVSVLAANNETGVLQPWAEAIEICRRHRIRFHCDAVQWIGKLPVKGLRDADFVTASGHKFGAPKGVGFIVLSAAQAGFLAQIGGGQENGYRAGTEDVAGIAALVAALEERLHPAGRPSTDSRNAFAETMRSQGAIVLGEAVSRLPNTVALLMPRFDRMRWITRLDRLGFAIGSGSACATGKEGPSATLTAMGVDAEQANRALRVSAGPDASPGDWQALADAFSEVASQLEDDAGEERLTTVIDI